MIPLTPPRLRTVAEEQHRSATWLELFYDLAFVVAVAMVAGRLHDDLTVTGTLAFLGYLGLLWWLWVSHTYYADRYDTDDLVYRLLAAGQMLAIVVIASSLTSGAADSTKAFAFGYAGARWLLLLMYLRAYRHVPETRALVAGYLRGFGSAAVLWTASILAPDRGRMVLWAVALSIDLATPWLMRREQARVPLDVSHLPERFGLFTILVLGESIAAVVAGLGHFDWSPLPTMTGALAIGVATALWWLYFDNVNGSVVRREADTARAWRPTVWLYSHFPLAAAIAASGVALEVAIVDAGHGSMSAAGKWLLVGSLSGVLASLALIQHAASDRTQTWGVTLTTWARLAGLVVLVAIGLLSTTVSALWVVFAVFMVCLSQIGWDMWAGGRHDARVA